VIDTEENMKRRWCPMARVARAEEIRSGGAGELVSETVVAGCNRDALGRSPDPIKSCRCIGSDCAWWTWIDGPDGHYQTSGALQQPKGDGWSAGDEGGWVRFGPRRGHCGATVAGVS
jgi:hypothetical protein